VMGVGLVATFFAAEPRKADAVMDAQEDERPLWTPRGFFDAVAGPFIVFFRAHGALALTMLLAISLYQIGYFMSGPMYNPMYVDVGLTKDMVGAARASFGIVGVWLGVAFGGYLPIRIGLTPALLVGGILLGLGTALYGVIPLNHQPVVFGLIMFTDNFSIAVAGLVLIAYMSSLSSLGYTATEYALLSSAYALGGKFLKGFSGKIVEGLTAQVGLMHAYSLFFVICGLIGVPSLILFGILSRNAGHQPAPSSAR